LKKEILEITEEMAGRPKLKLCPKCGKEFFIFHPENECDSVRDTDTNKKEKTKNGRTAKTIN
jgi:predicted  nucleic acid-binding Zn-ribbon protein